MNYATNFAIVKNGTVTNLLKGLVYNTTDDFPNAVHIEDLDVQIGDTYENGVFMRDGQVVTGGNVGVQSDWNQNDETQPDYVKNRPFYTGDPVETVLVEESTVSFVSANGIYMADIQSTVSATVGETYKVSWDGTVYECTCVSFQGMSAIGNLSIAGAGSDTGEPFVIAIMNGERIQIGTADTSASHTFSISGIASEIVKIDTKYIPVQVKNIPISPDDWTDEQKAQYLSDFQNGTVLILSDTTVASVITFLQYSKNLGLQVTYIKGKNIRYYDSSYGYGEYDMDLIEDRANNAQTTANNAQTTANNAKSDVSTKMDKTNPTGTGSFNLNRKADTTIGEYSFAEGYQTTASGYSSHAEGYQTTVSGYSSHAEGGVTIASSDYQHVQGKYNIEDSSNTYAHIVGNGTSSSARSNAHTLDWSGNAWYAGTVEGKALILPSSTSGSSKKFKITVDDSGTISATEVS